MQRILFTILAVGFLVSCKTNQAPKPQYIDLTALEGDGDKVMPKYLESITSNELQELLYVYASDEFEGRNTGEPGQKKAVAFLRDHYKDLNVPSGTTDDTYFQIVPETYFRKNSGIKASENVLAYIKGSEKPDEVLVISAHLDHVGVNDNGEVYNGADDDGSGTVALLEIAEAFQMAIQDGYTPKRSILFLHVTGEERGLPN